MKTDAEAVAGRVYAIMWTVTGGGLAAAWFFGGTAGTLGFLAGAAISFGNAYWMRRVALSVGADVRKAGIGSTLAVFRYLLMLGILYVILRFSETGFLAALTGCFVHIVAVVLEVVYELTYGTS
jgi:hypothetical protein